MVEEKVTIAIVITAGKYSSPQTMPQSVRQLRDGSQELLYSCSQEVNSASWRYLHPPAESSIWRREEEIAIGRLRTCLLSYLYSGRGGQEHKEVQLLVVSIKRDRTVTQLDALDVLNV
jgi:hypothetical protein